MSTSSVASPRPVLTDRAPAPIGPYSQAVSWNGLLFTAGQVALLPDGSFAGGDAGEQTRQALHNLATILEAGGSSLAGVLKTTIFLQDMNDFGAVNAVYAEFFGESAPARSTVQVARLPKDALVEIEAIAVISGDPQ